MMRYVAKQGQRLKKFRDTEDFIKKVELSRSSICFKIGFYKFLKTWKTWKTRRYHRIMLRITLK